MELRRGVGNRIYGCDDCLAVCPWNKFAQGGARGEDRPRPSWRDPPLAELAALDDAAFRARFAGSPIKRIGRDRFLRNVLIAIGNSGDAALRAGGARAARRRARRWCAGRRSGRCRGSPPSRRRRGAATIPIPRCARNGGGRSARTGLRRRQAPRKNKSRESGAFAAYGTLCTSIAALAMASGDSRICS